MSKENVEVVRKGYDNFNAGNIPAVLESYDPNIEWNEPGGGNAPAGTFNGVEAVASQVFSTVPENFDEFKADAEEFKDEGDLVVVTGRFKGKAKSGAELDAVFTHTLEVRDGKIVRFTNQVDDSWATAWGG